MNQIELFLMLCSCLNTSSLEPESCLKIRDSGNEERVWYTFTQRLVGTELKWREGEQGSVDAWKTTHCILSTALLNTDPYTTQVLSNGLATSVLIEAGYDASLHDNSPIITASSQGYLETVRLLLGTREVNPTARDNSAIRLATVQGHIKVVELLLEDPRVAASLTYGYNHKKIMELLEAFSKFRT